MIYYIPTKRIVNGQEVPVVEVRGADLSLETMIKAGNAYKEAFGGNSATPKFPDIIAVNPANHEEAMRGLGARGPHRKLYKEVVAVPWMPTTYDGVILWCVLRRTDLSLITGEYQGSEQGDVIMLDPEQTELFFKDGTLPGGGNAFEKPRPQILEIDF